MISTGVFDLYYGTDNYTDGDYYVQKHEYIGPGATKIVGGPAYVEYLMVGAGGGGGGTTNASGAGGVGGTGAGNGGVPGWMDEGDLTWRYSQVN